MAGKRFSNQSSKQILSHLSRLLRQDCSYNLFVDPLGIRFLLTESTQKKKGFSEKKEKIREEQKNMSPGQRKKSNTKKRIRPKIRSVKKGRTVPLKGRTY